MKVISSPEPTSPLETAIPIDPTATGLPTPVPDPSAALNAGDPQATWPMWLPGVDVFLAMLVLATAFLVASHIARNTDIWRHMGTGRGGCVY